SKTPSIIFSCLHMPDICLHSCIVHISDIAIPSFQLVIITPSFFHRESFYAIDSSFIHLPTLTCLLLLRGLCSWEYCGAPALGRDVGSCFLTRSIAGSSTNGSYRLRPRVTVSPC